MESQRHLPLERGEIQRPASRSQLAMLLGSRGGAQVERLAISQGRECPFMYPSGHRQTFATDLRFARGLPSSEFHRPTAKEEVMWSSKRRCSRVAAKTAAATLALAILGAAPLAVANEPN